MADNRDHELRRKGERLARELHEFLRRELEDEEEVGRALIGAFDYLDRRTVMLRRSDGRWPEQSVPRAVDAGSDHLN